MLFVAPGLSVVEVPLDGFSDSFGEWCCRGPSEEFFCFGVVGDEGLHVSGSKSGLVELCRFGFRAGFVLDECENGFHFVGLAGADVYDGTFDVFGLEGSYHCACGVVYVGEIAASLEVAHVDCGFF